MNLWIRKGSKWPILEENFPCKKEPISICFYGLHSEYRGSNSKRPLIDSYFKLTAIEKGLFIKLELKYEWPKFYKAILVPWKNIEVFKSDSLSKNGYHAYQIYNDGHLLGNLNIDHIVSDELIEFVHEKEYHLKVHSI